MRRSRIGRRRAAVSPARRDGGWRPRPQSCASTRDRSRRRARRLDARALRDAARGRAPRAARPSSRAHPPLQRAMRRSSSAAQHDALGRDGLGTPPPRRAGSQRDARRLEAPSRAPPVARLAAADFWRTSHRARGAQLRDPRVELGSVRPARRRCYDATAAPLDGDGLRGTRSARLPGAADEAGRQACGSIAPRACVSSATPRAAPSAAPSRSPDPGTRDRRRGTRLPASRPCRRARRGTSRRGRGCASRSRARRADHGGAPRSCERRRSAARAPQAGRACARDPVGAIRARDPARTPLVPATRTRPETATSAQKRTPFSRSVTGPWSR